MPSEFDFEAGFPGVLQSTCIAYDGVNTYSNVNISYNGGGTLYFLIGTADDMAGTNLTWQEVTSDTNTIILNPNKALFYKVVGTSGDYITDIRVKYS